MRCSSRRPRRASVLVEFALIALALMLLLAAIVDVGRAVHGAQVLQAAADLAAHELARTPLPAGMTFDQALTQADVKTKIYSDDYLVLDNDNLPPLSQWPLVNQQLRPLMIFDRVNGRNLLRYPGGLVSDASRPPPFPPYRYGGIYQVAYHPDGTETIDPTPLAVIEEIRSDPTNPATGPFSLTAAPNFPGDKPGYVAVRVNYPFQAATMSSYYRDPQNPLDGHQQVIAASDPVDPATLEASGQSPLYSGPEGLGQQYALLRSVRPFRKILSAQAVFRREVFTAN